MKPGPVRDEEDVYQQSDQKRLRLVHCDGCEQRDTAMHAMGIDLENSEAQMKAYRREIGRLKGALENERRESPHHVEAHKLFEYWRKTCRPGARSFGDDRLKAVLGRLNEKVRVPGEKRKQYAYSARYIAESIKGASLNPSHDRNNVPWNDLELICRDSSHLERFHDLWKAHMWPEASVEARAELYKAYTEAKDAEAKA